MNPTSDHGSSDPGRDRHPPPQPHEPSRFQKLLGMIVILAAVFFFLQIVWVGIQGGLEGSQTEEPVIHRLEGANLP